MTFPAKTRRAQPAALIVLALAVIGAAAMVYYHLDLFLPQAERIHAAEGLENRNAFGGDFYPIWLTLRESRAGHRDIYGAEMTRDIQAGLFGHPLAAPIPNAARGDYRSFAYPAFTDLLLWPAGEFDFPTLRLLLAVLLGIAIVGTVRLWMLALDWSVGPIFFVTVAVLMLSSYPVLEAMFAEQPGLIVGLMLAVSLFCLRRRRFLASGIFLALTTIKPQMTGLAIVYLVLWSIQDWRRRGWLAIGFLATGLLFIGASFFIWPHWVGGWLRITFGYYHYAPLPLAVELIGVWGGAIVIAALLAVAIAIAWQCRKTEPSLPQFWIGLSIMLAITTLAVLPGQAVYDHVILLPGILIVVRRWRLLGSSGKPLQIVQTIASLAFIWPWMAAFAVLVARLFIAPARFDSIITLAPPIRTASSLPFLVLVLLALSARSSIATVSDRV